jgi:hypothetical protein
MCLEVVCDSAKLSFGDMMIGDDGLVLLPSKQCSDDLLLLGLIERSVGHDHKSQWLSSPKQLTFAMLLKGGTDFRDGLYAWIVVRVARTLVALSSRR